MFIIVLISYIHITNNLLRKSETLKYQTRCSDLESLTAQLGLSERGAQAELLRATEREQLMRVQAFQSCLESVAH